MIPAHSRLTCRLIAERTRAGEYQAGQRNSRYQSIHHYGEALYPADKIDDESDDE
jgi:hypothetical protein